MGTQIMKSMAGRRAMNWMVGGAVLCASLTAPGAARADESTPTGKGIAGGVLLGGELVMSIEAIAGVTKPTAYALGAIGGGLLGGVGGYFVEQSVDDAKIPSYMLAAGIALLIPATVMAFNATAYKPPADYREDTGPIGTEPVADAPQSPQTAPQPSPNPAPAPAPMAPPPGGGGATTPPSQGPSSEAPAPRRPYAFRRRTLSAPALTMPTSVVAWQDGLRLGLPAVEVRPVFSQQELRQFGMAQREEVRVPVFQAKF